MHFKTPHSRSIALVAAGLVCAGCADFHRGPAPLDGGVKSDTDASTDVTVAPIVDLVFETSVYPILETYCEACHTAGGEGEYSVYVLTGNARLDRAMVVRLVTPGDATDSLLLRRATGEGHMGGQVLAVDSPEYQTISNWILGLE